MDSHNEYSKRRGWVSARRRAGSRGAILSFTSIVLLVWGMSLFEAVQATPPTVGVPSFPAEFLQAICLAVCTAVYWRIRRHRHRQEDPTVRKDRSPGKPRRGWMKGLQAWRIRTNKCPCPYETEYLNTTEHWADDPSCTLYKEFRRKFRIPYPVFCDIMDDAYASGNWSDPVIGKRKRGTPPTPIALKVLASLRVLALGCSMDGVSLESGVSQPALNKFFHPFMKFMVDKYYTTYVRMPNTATELDVNESIYSCLGLPGCMGSMDGVHFAWDNCPSPYLPLYKGKEGYPTVAYNVTVDHARRVMAVHGAFPGARNDKTIARTDPAVRTARFHPLYLEHTFNMYDSRGRQMTMSGVMCML